MILSYNKTFKTVRSTCCQLLLSVGVDDDGGRWEHGCISVQQLFRADKLNARNIDLAGRLRPIHVPNTAQITIVTESKSKLKIIACITTNLVKRFQIANLCEWICSLVRNLVEGALHCMQFNIVTLLWDYWVFIDNIRDWMWTWTFPTFFNFKLISSNFTTRPMVFHFPARTERNFLRILRTAERQYWNGDGVTESRLNSTDLAIQS